MSVFSVECQPRLGFFKLYQKSLEVQETGERPPCIGTVRSDFYFLLLSQWLNQVSDNVSARGDGWRESLERA